VSGGPGSAGQAADDAGAEVVARQVEQASARRSPARRPTQPLASAWAAKKPKVNTPTPATISHSGCASVSASPLPITATISHSTRGRPWRSASRPLSAEAQVPTR